MTLRKRFEVEKERTYLTGKGDQSASSSVTKDILKARKIDLKTHKRKKKRTSMHLKSCLPNVQDSLFNTFWFKNMMIHVD